MVRKKPNKKKNDLRLIHGLLRMIDKRTTKND
jgi:hypothetical protein